MIDQFIQALASTGRQPDFRNVEDILWLALHLTPSESQRVSADQESTVLEHSSGAKGEKATVTAEVTHLADQETKGETESTATAEVTHPAERQELTIGVYAMPHGQALDQA